MDDNSYTVLPTSPKGYEDVIANGEIKRVPSDMSQWGKQHGGKDRLTLLVMTAAIIMKMAILGVVIAKSVDQSIDHWAILVPAFAAWLIFTSTTCLLYVRFRALLVMLALFAVCAGLLVMFDRFIFWIL